MIELPYLRSPATEVTVPAPAAVIVVPSSVLRIRMGLKEDVSTVTFSAFSSPSSVSSAVTSHGVYTQSYGEAEHRKLKTSRLSHYKLA